MNSSPSSLLIFCLLNSITACGQQHKSNKFTINPDFQVYVDKFEQTIGESVEIDIDYNHLEYPIVGRCLKWTDGYKNIEIDPTHWPEVLDVEKEELILHELGHCILDRDHDQSMLSIDGYYLIPKTIMYPYLFGREYALYENYYLSELKNPETMLTDYLN